MLGTSNNTVGANYAFGLQIWDFNLGQLRTHEESDQLEVEYGSSDAVFMIKNIGELMKETSLSNTKMLGGLYQLDCPMAHDDISLFNVSFFSPPNTELCGI